MVAVLAILCGADDWVEVSFWGEANQLWLQDREICPNGIPSHDTFGPLFSFCGFKGI